MTIVWKPGRSGDSRGRVNNSREHIQFPKHIYVHGTDAEDWVHMNVCPARLRWLREMYLASDGPIGFSDDELRMFVREDMAYAAKCAEQDEFVYGDVTYRTDENIFKP